MRLSEWRATRATQGRDDAEGAGRHRADPGGAWRGHDPIVLDRVGRRPGRPLRVLVPTDAGLLQVLVRVNVPGEGPRASAKVIRWSRLQLGELGARDGERPPTPGLPGREPRPARHRRRGRRHARRSPSRSSPGSTGGRSRRARSTRGRSAKAGPARSGWRHQRGGDKTGRGQARCRQAGRRDPPRKPATGRRRRPVERLKPDRWPRPTSGSRPLHPSRRTIRYWASRLVAGAVTRAWLRIECEGFERLPGGPAIYCFNHLSWSDPFVLMATLPMRPRLSFFGPKEEDMGVGGRNRLMHWTGATIPYKPGKNDLLEATRKVGAVIAAGGIVAIAGEGRIGARRVGRAPAQRRTRLFRPAVARAARPDRHQRHELAAVRRSRPGPGRRADRRVRAARPSRRRHAMTAAAPGLARRRSSPMRRNPLAPAVPGRGSPSGSTNGRKAPAKRRWPPSWRAASMPSH